MAVVVLRYCSFGTGAVEVLQLPESCCCRRLDIVVVLKLLRSLNCHFCFITGAFELSAS